MISKIALILLSIFALSIEQESIELPLYGTITTDKEIYFYINTERYLKGENLRVYITFESNCTIKYLSILYGQMNSTSPGYMEVSGSSAIPSKKKYSTGCIVRMNTNSKYYIFKTPTIRDCSHPIMEITHIKEIFDYKLPIYGNMAVSRQSSFNLDIRNFDIEDKLTIRLLFVNSFNYTDITIKSQQYYFDVSSNSYKDIKSFIHSKSGEIDIFYFTIGFKIKPSLHKYLSIILPEEEEIYKYSNVTIMHTINMPTYELIRYEEMNVSEQSCLYLNLENFTSSNIYLELSFLNKTKDGYDSLPLPYYFSNDTTYNTFDKVYLKNNNFSSINSMNYTFYYTIEITVNAKYLVFYTPFFIFNDTKVIIKNMEEKRNDNSDSNDDNTNNDNNNNDNDNNNNNDNKNNNNKILYIIIPVGIIFIICIIVIFIVIRKKRKENGDLTQDNLRKMVDVSPELNDPIPLE